jgi:hypothetical protein
MENEKFQDTDRAVGLEEIACELPVTQPSIDQPSAGNRGIAIQPH